MKEAKPLALLCFVLLLAQPEWAKAEQKTAVKSEDPGATKIPSAKNGIGDRARAYASDAQTRADTATKANKELVGKRLRALAVLWNRVAEAEERAAKIEAEARKLEQRTLTVKAKRKRATSLVEQSEARRSRALARLRKLGLSDASPQTKAQPQTPEQSEKKAK